MNPVSGTRRTFDGSAVYSIVVQGDLDAEWSDRLGGMTITATLWESGSPITTLVGELRDQAALSGVLETLYTLHLPVISVQRLAVGI